MALQQAEPRHAAPLPISDARPLNPVQRVRLAAEILTAYLQARRALRRAPIASVVATLRSQAVLAPSSSTTAATESMLEEARRLGWAVARTLALLPGDTRCLAASLVVHQ